MRLISTALSFFRSSRLAAKQAQSLLLIATLAAVAVPAQAADRFRLDLDNMRIRGSEGEQTINLRKLLREQHGDFDAERFELRNVLVVGKSRKNNGQIKLTVNDIDGAPTAVAGTPDRFNDNAGETFGRYELQPANPAASNGRWLLKAEGGLKLRRVLLWVNDCAQGDCVAQTQPTTRKLSFNDTVYRLAKSKDAEQIGLRAELKKAYGIELNDAELKNVQLISKTRQGQTGRALLINGEDVVRRMDLPGGPGQFKGTDPASYRSTNIEPRLQNRKNRNDTRGRWILQLQGANIKVKEILVTTIDRAYWRPGQPSAASSSNTSTDAAPRNLCTAGNCPSGSTVVKSASGPRSCYASSDGRQIDRREGAMVKWREGCVDGTCKSRTETCFESRTCLCANGRWRRLSLRFCDQKDALQQRHLRNELTSQV